MHPFFEPLNDRDAMLLLTTLTVGGADGVALFAGLPDSVRGPIEEKASALKGIEAGKRVPFMVRQMQIAMETDGLGNVQRAEPTWLLHALKGESPTVVAVVLSTLPREITRTVLGMLPEAIRNGLPDRQHVTAIPIETRHRIRQLFDRRLAPMPVVSTTRLTFLCLINLSSDELNRLMRDLGLLELGQAFAAMGKMALVGLCRRLSRERARELVEAVRTASGVDAPDRKIAEDFLAKVVANFSDTEELFHKAGLWRLASALLLEEEAFSTALAQRFRRSIGLQLRQYVGRARELQQRDDAGLQRLQDSILVRVRRLAERGALPSAYAQVPIIFHQSDAGMELQLPE